MQTVRANMPLLVSRGDSTATLLHRVPRVVRVIDISTVSFLPGLLVLSDCRNNLCHQILSKDME